MPSFRERLRAVRPGSRSAGQSETTIEIIVDEHADPGDAAGGGLLVEPGDPPGAVVRAARRERSQLERRLAQVRDDLGGLLIEMARRNRFNHQLLERRAAEAVEIEAAMADLDAQVAAAGQERRPIDAELAAESVPLPVDVTAACGRCGAGLVGDVNFCGYCGAPRGDG